MHPAAKQATTHSHPHTPAGVKVYNARHPEQTLLYRIVAEHFETWLALASAGQFDGQGDHHTPPTYVEQAFRKYLECAIFAHGFARERCADCGHDFLIAFSCKGRGVCPSCNSRRMAETAAHLADHVFPPFAMERLRQRGADLVYHCPKPQSGGKRADLVLTQLELTDRIAPARGPPLWDGRDAQAGEGLDGEPEWVPATQIASELESEYQVDPRISW